MKDKFLMRQIMEGKGPEMLALERSRELTDAVVGSQTTPYQLHGVSSRGFQLESAAFGSSNPNLALWR